jgi:hypothetical protein
MQWEEVVVYGAAGNGCTVHFSNFSLTARQQSARNIQPVPPAPPGKGNKVQRLIVEGHLLRVVVVGYKGVILIEAQGRSPWLSPDPVPSTRMTCLWRAGEETVKRR